MSKRASKLMNSLKEKQDAEQETIETPIVSKRELVRRGEYQQLGILLSKHLVKRLKRLELERDDADLSDLVAEAIEDLLVKYKAG